MIYCISFTVYHMLLIVYRILLICVKISYSLSYVKNWSGKSLSMKASLL